MPDSHRRVKLTDTVRRAGLMSFLVLVCASIIVALILTVKMIIELFF